MKLFFLVIAIISSGIATLVGVTFCLAMGANSTPAQIRTIKLWVLGISLVGLAGIVAGIVLWRAGAQEYAAGAAIVPAVFVLVAGIVAIAKSK